MASAMFNKGLVDLFSNAGIDLSDANTPSDLEVALMGNSYTLDTGVSFRRSTSAYESGAGQYVVKSLPTLNVSSASNYITFDALDVTWTALGGTTNGTITGAIIYRAGTDSTQSPLICFIDNIVMDEGSRMDQFHRCRHMDEGFPVLWRDGTGYTGR